MTIVCRVREQAVTAFFLFIFKDMCTNNFFQVRNLFLQIDYVYIIVYNVIRKMHFFERISSYRFSFSSRESYTGHSFLICEFPL